MPALSCDPTSNLKANQVLNLSCFAPPAIGTNGPRQDPYLAGPAYFNWDLAVYKSFHITERQNVQFRFSAFNFLNHPIEQFSGNNQATLSYTRPDANSPWVYNGSVASNQWGVLNSKIGQRQLEMGIKYTF